MGGFVEYRAYGCALGESFGVHENLVCDVNVLLYTLIRTLFILIP